MEKNELSNLNLNKWISQVSASEDEIVNALKRLNREPNDASELEKLIFRHEHEKLNKVLEESEKQLNFVPY